MQIVKLLDQLDKLETQLAELYQRFSEVFRNDAEASTFFYQMSVDETAHADLVRFERHMFDADPARFSDVDVDCSEIEKILFYVGLLLRSARALTVQKALQASIDIESSAADQHSIPSATLSNPDTARLFKNLTAFDCRHFSAAEDFARRRGYALKTKKTEQMHSCGRGESKREEQPNKETVVHPRPVNIPQEFIDKIDYLCTWHKNMGHYKLLGINRYATEPEIKRAYHRMAKEFHPDRHLDFPDDLREKLTLLFSYINSAYTTLIVPEKRREYDATLRSTRMK